MQFSKFRRLVLLSLLTMCCVATASARDPGERDILEIQCVEYVPADTHLAVEVTAWVDEAIMGLVVPLTFHNPLNTDLVLDSVSFVGSDLLDFDFVWANMDFVGAGMVLVYAVSVYWNGDSLQPGNHFLFTLYFTTGPAWEGNLGTLIDTTTFPPASELAFVTTQALEFKPLFVPGCLSTSRPPDFDILAEPDTLIIDVGDSASYLVNLISKWGFDSPCTLSVSDLPSGVMASFDSTVLTPTGYTALRIFTNDTVSWEQVYDLTISATGGERTHNTWVSLAVNIPGNAPPRPFVLYSPQDDSTLDPPFTLTWQKSVDPDIFDEVVYTVYYSIDSNFVSYDSIASVYDTSCNLVGLTEQVQYFWKVKANDESGESTWSEQMWRFFTPECTPGDVNFSGSIDGNDFLHLFSYLFKKGPAPTCLSSADMDSVSGINVGDPHHLVNYVYRSGPRPFKGPFPDTIIPISATDTVIVKLDNPIFPEADKYQFNIDLKNSTEFHSGSIPLIYAGSPGVVCDSISYIDLYGYGDWNHTIDHDEQTISIGLVRFGQNTLAPGIHTMAKLFFTIVDTTGFFIDTSFIEPGNSLLLCSGPEGKNLISPQFVVQPGFKIWAAPDTQTCNEGDSTTYVVKFFSIFGFNSPCTLSVHNLPTGVVGMFEPPVVLPSDTSVLTVKMVDLDYEAIHTLIILAHNGEIADSTEVNLIAIIPGNEPPDPFSLLFPTDGDTLRPGWGGLFGWERPSDPDLFDFISSYNLYFSTDSTLSASDSVTHLGSNALFRWEIEERSGFGGFVEDTSYFWKAKALDTFGDSRWSTETWRFHTPTLIPGDVDWDQWCGFWDIYMLFQYVNGGLTDWWWRPIFRNSADIDSISGVNIGDVNHLTRYVCDDGFLPYEAPFPDSLVPISTQDTVSIDYVADLGSDKYQFNVYLRNVEVVRALSVPLQFFSSGTVNLDSFSLGQTRLPRSDFIGITYDDSTKTFLFTVVLLDWGCSPTALSPGRGDILKLFLTIPNINGFHIDTTTVKPDNHLLLSSGVEGRDLIIPQFLLRGSPGFLLSEISSRESTLVETLLSKKAVLTNVQVSGDFNSVLDFTDFEIVSITTGPFAGKGFSKGEFETTLEGILYQGEWKGALFLKPQERKIYLKGAVTGQISATVEGYLTESDSGSGIYDQYQATWRIGGLGMTTTSATINLNGTVSYQSSSEFPAAELYILQTNIEGTISGHYSRPLSTVLTHLRVAEETNPYSGEGFSIMSYNSESGAGEGFTYDKLVSPGRVELKGLFTSPLFGIASATLDETETPRTLFLRIERIDFGLPPAADLKVTTWGPGRVSPGQTINYVIEYRNDGLKAAEDIDIVMKLPYEVEFVSAMGGGTYTEASHEVIWYLGNVLPKSAGQLSAEVRVLWGLPWGTSFETIVSIPKERIEIITDPTVVTSSEILEISEDSLKAMGTISNQFHSDSFYMDVTSTIVPEEIEPVFELVETAEGIELRIKVTVEAHSPANLLDILIKVGEKALPLFDAYEGSREFKKAQMELQPFIDALRYHNFISEEDHETICGWNSGWFFGRATIGVFEIFFPTKLGERLDKARGKINVATKVGIGIRIAKHLKWDLPSDPEDRVQAALDLFQELHKGYLDATSHDIDSHKNEVAVARDPNIKYGPEGYVQPGQKLDYKAEYENEGEGIAFGVYFTDMLDEDLDDSTLTIGPVIDVETGVQIAPPGTYNPQTRTITWFVGEVGPGQGGYAEFSVNIRSDAPKGTEVINYATVYFPSVPEITRTNGVVSIIPMNEPPIANAGPDQTLECTSPDSAQVTLGGTGSSDPDNDPLTFTWCEEGNIIAGPTTDPISTVTLALGTYAIELTVDDGQGETDTDEVVIDVVDTTPPSVAALLIPQESAGDDDNLYKIYCSASDICDPDPQLLGMDINGTSVSNGQLVVLEAGDEFEQDIDDGLLKLWGDRLILTCTAQDAPENVGKAQTTPIVTARSKAFWKNQFGRVLSGKSEAKDTKESLIGYLNSIRNDFDVFDEVIDVTVDQSNFETIFEKVLTLLDPKGNSMRPKAEAQAMALLLNLASDRLALTTVVSTDDFLLDALNFILPVLSNTDASMAELEQVKDIADPINEAELFEDPDFIPGGSFVPPSAKPGDGREQAVSVELPEEFGLMQNYPNPFNPVCNIAYALPTDCQVTLIIYNILGQKVETLVDEHQSAGYRSVKWDGKDAQGQDIASGVYFYRIQAGDFTQVRKMVLLK